MVANINFVFHIFTFIGYSYTLVYELLYVGEEYEPYVYLFTYKGFAGKFKFLTFINLILQNIFFGLSLINDLWGTHVRPSDHVTKKSGLQKFMDTYIAAIVYPVGTFVVMTFWAIYAVDRELVFPKHLDSLVPSWLNHVMHTTVLPILVMEKYLIYHEYPSRRMGLAILLSFAMVYLLWILWVAYYANFWVYPILQVMENHQRVIFITVLMAFFVTIYILGESVNNMFWRKEIAVRKKKLKSKKIS